MHCKYKKKATRSNINPKEVINVLFKDQKEEKKKPKKVMSRS